jgi:hypothetical protein
MFFGGFQHVLVGSAWFCCILAGPGLFGSILLTLSASILGATTWDVWWLLIDCWVRVV